MSPPLIWSVGLFRIVQTPVNRLRHILHYDRNWDVSILGVWWWLDDSFRL